MRAPRPDLLVRILVAVVGAAALRADAPVSAGSGAETFYMVVYGAQEDGFRPNTSHCFATFARFDPGSGGEPLVELRHINWFSRRGHVTGMTRALTEEDGLPVVPEPGENRTTRQALLMVGKHGLKVTRWGPYEIHRELYERAMRQIDLLEGRVSGRRVLYKELDHGLREERVVALNCIHAISDVDREHGPLRTGAEFGERAARTIVLHFGRWIKEVGRDHPGEWQRIWEATWRPGPVPGGLTIRQGSL